MPPAFGEDEGPLAAYELYSSTDELLGMPLAVDRRGIDPVHTAIEGVEHRSDRLRVTFGGAAVSPAGAADRPGGESGPADGERKGQLQRLVTRMSRARSGTN